MTIRISGCRAAITLLTLLSCSSPDGDATQAPLPTPDAPAEDWPGPPVHAAFLADGSLRIVLTAPTGGHAFAVQSVGTDGGQAIVTCAHTPPAVDAVVTQVVTEHAVLVDGAKIPAGMSQVTIVCSTRNSDGETVTREVWKRAN